MRGLNLPKMLVRIVFALTIFLGPYGLYVLSLLSPGIFTVGRRPTPLTLKFSLIIPAVVGGVWILYERATQGGEEESG